MNQHDASGAPIDPISLAPIPLHRRITVRVTEDPFHGTLGHVPTDYYCFDKTYLLEWLKGSIINPLTNIAFSDLQLKEIQKEIDKTAPYVWPNGYRSFFSHMPTRQATAADPSPWPEAFRAALMRDF